MLSIWDFPGGPVVKNQPSNAGDMGSIPGRGIKIPHATGQLSLWATTTKPTCHNQREAGTLQQRGHAPQLRPDAAKNNINK